MTKKPKKQDEKELSVLQKTGLFFMNLCKLPSKNGERRLIKNITTGKWEWTAGDEPLPTTVESLDPSILKPDLAQVKLEEKQFLNHQAIRLSVEPYRPHRFIFSFPGIEEWSIQEVRQLSEDQVEFKVWLTYPYSEYDIVKTLDDYKTASKDARKRKLKKDATLTLLDTVGFEVGMITFKNVAINLVEYFTEVSYDSDGLMYGKVVFNHEGAIKTL